MKRQEPGWPDDSDRRLSEIEQRGYAIDPRLLGEGSRRPPKPSPQATPPTDSADAFREGIELDLTTDPAGLVRAGTRLLFVGDMAATGFGSVTTDLGRAMLDIGLDVRFLSQNDLGPSLGEPFASRTVDVAFYEYQASAPGVTGIKSLVGDIIDGIEGQMLMDGTPFGDWRPDAVVILSDFAAARLLHARFAASLAKVPVWHYVPIEGVDLPPLWGELWKVLRPVAMSRFGQEEIARVTGSMPPLAYHGVDRSVFRPISPSDPITVPADVDGTRMVTLRSREAAKVFFGFDPKWTVVLRTDRNMPRKRYASLLRAMAPVLEERPDMRLVLHCSAFDQGGFLPDTISKMPPAAASRVIITDRPGLPRDVLAALYNAADLYVSTSAEGFGLTIAEAASCGVPVVGMDYSAVPEVIGPAGVVVPPHVLYDNEYDHLWAWPDEEAFGKAVAYLADHPAKRRALGADGPRHVAANFTWDAAARVFADLVAGDTMGVDAPSGTDQPESIAA